MKPKAKKPKFKPGDWVKFRKQDTIKQYPGRFMGVVISTDEANIRDKSKGMKWEKYEDLHLPVNWDGGAEDLGWVIDEFELTTEPFYPAPDNREYLEMISIMGESQ